MRTSLLLVVVVALVAVSAGPLRAAGQTIKASEARAFIGTWSIAMTNPKGAQETVRLWDESGVVRASVQAQRFPPLDASGIMKIGNVLILSLTRYENGKPDHAVVALTLDGDTMSFSQMLELSPDLKVGTGK